MTKNIKKKADILYNYCNYYISLHKGEESFYIKNILLKKTANN